MLPSLTAARMDRYSSFTRVINRPANAVCFNTSNRRKKTTRKRSSYIHNCIFRSLNKQTISIEQTIADQFKLSAYGDVFVEKIEPAAVTLDLIELIFKEQFECTIERQ